MRVYAHKITNHVRELVKTESEVVILCVMFLNASRVLHPDLASCVLLVWMRVKLSVSGLPRVPFLVQLASENYSNKQEKKICVHGSII